MAILTNDMQVYIIRCLASFMTPQATAEAVSEEFEEELRESGQTISRMQVAKYDPTKISGKDLKKEWVDLFNESRETFKSDLEAIPIANKAYRVMTLHTMMLDALDSKNRPLAASFIEQAAKDMGDYYTNKRQVELESPKGSMTPKPVDLSRLTDDELRTLHAIAVKSKDD